MLALKAAISSSVKASASTAKRVSLDTRRMHIARRQCSWVDVNGLALCLEGTECRGNIFVTSQNLMVNLLQLLTGLRHIGQGVTLQLAGAMRPGIQDVPATGLVCY